MSELASLAELQREVQLLRQVADSHGFVTFLSDLGSDDLQLCAPIAVTIRPDGDEFIASYFDAGLSSGGSTAQEAIASLQSYIADSYRLHRDATQPLGPTMLRQRNVLLAAVCPKSPNSSPQT